MCVCLSARLICICKHVANGNKTRAVCEIKYGCSIWINHTILLSCLFWLVGLLVRCKSYLCVVIYCFVYADWGVLQCFLRCVQINNAFALKDHKVKFGSIVTQKWYFVSCVCFIISGCRLWLMRPDRMCSKLKLKKKTTCHCLVRNIPVNDMRQKS